MTVKYCDSDKKLGEYTTGLFFCVFSTVTVIIFTVKITATYFSVYFCNCDRILKSLILNNRET